MNAGYNQYTRAALWWLHGEDAYQFDKNERTLHADPQASIEALWQYEIANKLSRFRTLDRSAEQQIPVQLLALQTLFKSAAAARGVVVWTRVLNGSTMPVAQRASWAPIKKALKDASRPVDLDNITSLLREAPTRARVEQTAGVLAVAAAHYIHDSRLDTLPQPGVASGEIQPVLLGDIPAQVH